MSSASTDSRPISDISVTDDEGDDKQMDMKCPAVKPNMCSEEVKRQLESQDDSDVSDHFYIPEGSGDAEEKDPLDSSSVELGGEVKESSGPRYVYNIRLWTRRSFE